MAQQPMYYARLENRFAELSVAMEAALGTVKKVTGAFGTVDEMDNGLYTKWVTSAAHLINLVCGPGSVHATEFAKIRDEKSSYFGNIPAKFKQLGAIFISAKEEVHAGTLVSIRSLVEADLFVSQIDQAKELLSSNFNVASAVVAGVVLETTVKSLCDKHGVGHAKFDSMIIELQRKGVFNKLDVKAAQSHYGVRNAAAHGSADFDPKSVAQMISGVEFICQKFTC